MWVLAGSTQTKTLTQLDLSTKKTITIVPISKDATAVAQSSIGTVAVGVGTATSGAVELLNGTSGTVNATIPVGAPVKGLAFGADGVTLYVLNGTQSSSSITEINASNSQVITTIGSPKDAVGLYPDPQQKDVWTVQSTGNVQEISLQSGVAVGLTSLDSPGTALTISPTSGDVYVLKGSGSVWNIDHIVPGKFKPAKTIAAAAFSVALANLALMGPRSTTWSGHLGSAMCRPSSSHAPGVMTALLVSESLPERWHPAPGRWRGHTGRVTSPTATDRVESAVPNEADHVPNSQRIWWTVVGLALVEWSIRIYSSVTTFSLVTVAVVVVGLWGLLTVATSWLPATSSSHLRPWRTGWGWISALLTVSVFGLWAVLQIHQSPGYGTDEIAFDQYAGTLALHGINPYLHSMAPSFNLFRVPPDGFTYTLTGHAVTALSYPASSFLLYVPFLALGLHTQLAIGLNVAAWAVSILLLFVLLPQPYRPAALVIGSFSTFVAYTVGGVTDALYIPFLLIAAFKWDQFAIESGWRRWRGPVFLGLAMSIKQTPWLLLPFLVIAITLESRSRFGPRRGLKVGASYLAVALAVFLVPNLFYLVNAPGAWLHSIFIPFTASTVPAGQGAMALSLYLGLGGGSLTAYSAVSVVVLLGLLLAFTASYPLMRPLTFLLPSLALFFATRSFGSYLVWLVPVVVLGALTVDQPPSRRLGPLHLPQSAATEHSEGRPLRPWSRWRWVLGGAVLCSLIAFLVALAIRPPLTVSIVGIRTTGQLATVSELRVLVTNNSGSPVSPSFTLDEGGSYTTFWPATQVRPALGPGQRATYTLRAPNFFSQAPIGGGFQVVAFTSTPAALSTSSSYAPATLHVGLGAPGRGLQTPTVPLGRVVTVHAQLFNPV